MSSQPININSKKEWLCPYLGFVDDNDTALSYPSQLNYCYHAKPVCSVNQEHQSHYCLNGQFTTCPVYMDDKITALPKELRGRNRKGRKINSWVSITFLIVVVLLSVIACNALGIIQIPGFGKFTLSSTKIPADAVPTTATEIVAVPTTITPAVTETATIEPTSTITSIPTEVAMHQLETPFGVTPSFVIHKVIGGESLSLLAEKFQTTKEAILAINNNLNSGLWENAVIVIPVGMTNMTGVPIFSVYQVVDDNLTIESLANKDSVDVNLLMKYNSLPAGYMFKKGEWVIIPQ